MKVKVPFSTIDFETGEATFKFSQALIWSRRWRAGTVEIDISDISIDLSEPVVAPLDNKEAGEQPITGNNTSPSATPVGEITPPSERVCSVCGAKGCMSTHGFRHG